MKFFAMLFLVLIFNSPSFADEAKILVFIGHKDNPHQKKTDNAINFCDSIKQRNCEQWTSYSPYLDYINAKKNTNIR